MQMLIQEELFVLLTVAIVWSMTKHRIIQQACVIGMIVCVLIHLFKSAATMYRLCRVNLDGMNEVLLLETKLGPKSCLFLLDTGYAGPPVLSRSYLAVNDPSHLPLRDRYQEIMIQLTSVEEDDEHRAINAFISSGSCLPYTSGCTMRLMGIGSTEEQQADMLMCPMLRMKNVNGGFVAPKKNTLTFADMFVTNSLKQSIHILTCDFILHHSPCLICIGKQKLELSISPSKYMSILPFFHVFPATFSGGSFVVPFHIGDEVLNCTVDTGAPGPICVGKNALEKIKKCSVKERKSLKQSGVNGEVICSEIIESEIKFGTQTYTVPLFVNDLPTEYVDGYVGLGFLRAFDILVTTSGIGFRKNKLSFKSMDYYSEKAQDGSCSIKLECLD